MTKARNCFVLIDAGTPNRRAELGCELTSAGCELGNLKLIVLAHGDIDHTANGAYLRDGNAMGLSPFCFVPKSTDSNNWSAKIAHTMEDDDNKCPKGP